MEEGEDDGPWTEVTLPRKQFLALLRQIVVIEGGKDVSNRPEGESANGPKAGRSKRRRVPRNTPES